MVVGLAVGFGVSQFAGHHTAGRQLVGRAADRYRRRPDLGFVRVGRLLRRRRFRRERLHLLGRLVVRAAAAQSNGLSWVSCPTAGFCVATSNGSLLYTYSGGKWSPPTELFGDNGKPAHLTSVSCATATFCMATGNMHAYRYSGGTWARGVLVESSNKLVSISCPSATFCAVVDSAGNAYTYSGSSWSAPQRLSSTAMTGCRARRPASAWPRARTTLYAYSGGAWSPSGPLTTADGGPVHLTSVSCATASSCVATGNADGYAYSDGSWARGVVVHHSNKSPRFRARRPTSASPSTQAAASTPTRRPRPTGSAATLRFPLFTFRLQVTAFALFDEHQGPLSSGDGDEVRRRRTMTGSFKEGPNSS